MFAQDVRGIKLAQSVKNAIVSITKNTINARGVSLKDSGSKMTTLVRHQAIADTQIEVDSPQWLKWLNQNSSFRYECEYGAITLIKDDRQYWTASKKVDGRLRRKRTGRAEDLTSDRLRALTALLCLNGIWNEYLREKTQRERETKRGLKRKIEYLERELEKYKKVADLGAEE